MTNEEKLQHFTQTVMEAARAKSNSIIDDYTDGLNAIDADFRAERDRQAALKIDAETNRLRLENNRSLHSEQLQLRREVSDHVTALKERLFSEVSTKLEEYMKTPQYFDWLADHIRKAKTFAGEDEIVVYIDPADERLRLTLEEKTNVQLSVNPKAFFGGVRAVIPARHMLIDYSFATKLKEEKAGFLFGGHAS